MTDTRTQTLVIFCVRSRVFVRRVSFSCICTTQIIMAKAAGGPKAPKQRGHWDKDDWDEEPDKFETHQ